MAALVSAAPARAQPRRSASHSSLRPFLVVGEQRFAAAQTFDAVFGSTRGTFLGGGGQVIVGRWFVDVTASRFKKTGERVFVFEDQTFHLGIPLTVTVVPVEFAFGYRAPLGSAPSVVPYAGAGFGTYRYQETSDFADAGEDVDERHGGYLLVYGVEFRVHRWIGVSADVHYTHVGGILGGSGVSKDLGEDDLGGVAARFRVLIGR